MVVCHLEAEPARCPGMYRRSMFSFAGVAYDWLPFISSRLKLYKIKKVPMVSAAKGGLRMNNVLIYDVVVFRT